MGLFDVGLLGATIRLSSPLLLAATGETVAERAGVLNIGIEGMMLTGAFTAYAAAQAFSSAGWGIVCGLIAGVLVALVSAGLVLTLAADQVVVGVGINLLALGFTTFAFRLMPTSNSWRLGAWRIPFLSQIPHVGRTLFEQSPVVYSAYLLPIAVTFLLYRSGLGLKIRAAGDAPTVAAAVGVNVGRVRLVGILIGGAAAGLAGASLSVGQVGSFTEGMTAGRGFLALAAVIFGSWQPLRVAAACFLFGGADALQLRLQTVANLPGPVRLTSVVVVLVATLVLLRRGGRRRLNWTVSLIVAGVGLAAFGYAAHLTIPPSLWLALPYVLSLASLGVAGQRGAAPAALGISLYDAE